MLNVNLSEGSLLRFLICWHLDKNILPYYAQMMRNVTCCILRLSTLMEFLCFHGSFIYQIPEAGDNNIMILRWLLLNNTTNQLFVRVLEVADPADDVHQVAGLALLHKPDKKLASGGLSLHVMVLLKSSRVAEKSKLPKSITRRAFMITEGSALQ